SSIIQRPGKLRLPRRATSPTMPVSLPGMSWAGTKPDPSFRTRLSMSLDLKSLVRTIPDYPKKGILFRDITTLIEHPEGFRESIERIAASYRGQGISHVA